ncbi:hypothetical protein BDY17DRAFT_291611 [Neohortaea acidophila]|uniref:Uncharacterized protein n=1 Tax=Neohortaea acidophila TaxID=245834 RepID=A0A6A6Q3C0_9PEZI|nr:uncharacterized protein BDY17DRAFT_291611 [Neohortaea acidophila]KAF2486504.1 hypothetical protein BDY17DRAFT_291611 [Neohortaea acidophila]
MSSDRTTHPQRPPLKPSLSSNRTARVPVAPRVAAPNATVSVKAVASQPVSTVRSDPPGSRVRQTPTPVKDVFANGNITPRSSARSSRPGSASASPMGTPRQNPVVAAGAGEKRGYFVAREGTAGSKPQSMVGDGGRAQSPLVRSPTLSDLSPPSESRSFESRFFHASDVASQEPVVKKPEPPKKAQFFHADGMQEAESFSPAAASSSPVLSAVSEQKSHGPWVRAENAAPGPKSPPPILSPALSALSATSPFFAPASPILPGQRRSPSPSKENIHLSYRKGVSQIIGTRPTPAPRSTITSADNVQLASLHERQGSTGPTAASVGQHTKSLSVSSARPPSAFSGHRKSTTIEDTDPLASPLIHEIKAVSPSWAPKPQSDLPSIDTSLESPGSLPRSESLTSTKAVSELAAEARRERKVLDLEISNSSLLAINASLEREVRRQRAELKSFRRLSRAGRFSFAPADRGGSGSADLGALAEEDEEDGDNMSDGDLDDLSSDDEDESTLSSGEPLSLSAQDRLAKDEKRLNADLEKHRELLVQSQAMNQSLKRCMYATEDMIREGKKALEYHVRVSDVKLGGRVLSTHDDGEVDRREIEVADEAEGDDSVAQARTFLDTWTNVGEASVGSSEGGDRDSGIEVDRLLASAGTKGAGNPFATEPGRPPGLVDLGRFGSFS